MIHDFTITQGSYDLNSWEIEKHMKLATAWQIKRRFSLARESYEKAIQLEPNYIPAYLGLGNLFAQTGQTSQAIETYRQAVALNATETWLPAVIDALLTKYQDFTQQESQINIAIEPYRAALRQKSTGREAPHIVLYTNCPGTYGAEQASHALMCHLAQSGYRVTCIQSKADHHLIRAREEMGIQHIWLKGDAHKVWYSVSNVSEVANIFSQTLPDLVIFADGGPVSNLAANWVAMQLEIPYIRVIHCVDPDWAAQFATYLPFLPAIYQSAQAVISVSHANMKLMRQRFMLPAQVGQVIYNGRPDEYFASYSPETRDRLRQALGIPQDAVVILTTARLEAVKGYQHQFNAIAQLRHTPLWPQLFFVWAGTGSLEVQLKAKIEAIGGSEQVKFLGERSDIPDLLEAADIFLLPSHAEGMPLAVMEAMAKGLPVMATAIGGIPEELGETGKLLPDPNVDAQATVQAIVETIQTWGRDAALRQAIGQECQQRALDMFREDQMLESYLKVIHPILARSSAHD